ncbi:FAD-dependent oxidoreductase [Fulvimonas soli]|nr:FAD-dependent oxidoreductase [Fulvimonas soli]
MLDPSPHSTRRKGTVADVPPHPAAGPPVAGDSRGRMSTLRYPHLFSPIQLGVLKIPNRVVMAPMSTQLGGSDGRVTERQIAFYRARAEGGVGLIIVEFCCVDRATGLSEHRQLSLDTPAHLEGHRRLVEAIRDAGAVACLQLQHGGAGVPRALVEGGVAVGPSDVRSRRDPSRLTARALTGAQIEYLIDCFGRTAALGVQAGYQAFELHGAHGYLLTQFLSPLTNHRDDDWGGDEERRLRLPRRVIACVKHAIGQRPLSFRLSADEFSPDGLGIEDMVRIAPKLVEAGVDVLHVSMGTGYTGLDKVIDPMSAPEGWRLPYARRIRQAVSVPVISVGQIRWPATAEAAIARGDADMIALGRPLLADPAWAGKARRGDDDDICPCTSCNFCVTSHAGPHGVIGCAENPRTGRELDPPFGSDARCEGSAVVVGGGPGGMATALMLDQAGYRTKLYEARASLGGGLIASAAPPFKDKLDWYRQYLERQLARSGVETATSSHVDAATLIRLRPDIVILAGGARAVRMEIDGIDGENVLDAYDVLMGDARGLASTGAMRIVVYGGGETGCETAEYLAGRGHEVVLVSRSPAEQLARSAEAIYRGVLLKRLFANAQVRIVDRSEIVAIRAGSVTLKDGDGATAEIACDRVLIAQGRRPDDAFAQALKAAGIPFVAIGDAHHGGRIGDAVHSGYAAVSALLEAQRRRAVPG